MAFTTLARKSASSLAPLARQILRGQKIHNYHSYSAVLASLSNAGRGGPTGLARRQPCLCPVCCSRLRLYSKTSSSDGNVLKVIESSSSDENLLKVIESEIGYAQETDDHDKVEQAPSGFPFQIQDHPGQQTITLTRDYQGEEITIEVHMPDLVTGEDDEDDDDDCDEEKANQSSIPLVVNVSKKNGPVLEFGCTAYPDEINIDSLSIKNPEASEDQIAYEGPDFHDLDENLQKAFYKYLEIRGIKPSTTNFLHEYMINKDSREYLMWLKNVKNFIEA